MSVPEHSDGLVAETPRRVVRVPDRGWLGGVCSGLADHLGVPAAVFRAAFVVLGSWRLLGVAAYLVLWLVLPRAPGASAAPGLDAARRQGRRRTAVGRRDSLTADAGQALALTMLGGGLTWLLQLAGWGLEPTWLLIGLLAAGGIAPVWWQADHVAARDSAGGTGWRRWLAPFVAQWTTGLALGVGVAAVAVAIGLTVAALPGLGDLARTLVVIVLSLTGLALLAAPWLVRVRGELTAAREARLLSDARADMAAHLHDSVLQTLALIQRQADDPREVVRLARRQERELREWLYGVEEPSDTLRAALTAAAQEVEDDFPVSVECVSVGDAPLSPGLSELVKAAREAMVNAAKHSGVALVDVYAEVADGAVEVFVRDRGRGFDTTDIADDRLGIRRSIMDRMRRHHGTATIRSDPERGTEVRLEMRT